MVSIEGPCFGKGALCEAVLRALPDWFGIEEAVRQYALDIDRLPTFLVMEGDRALGFLSVKIHNTSHSLKPVYNKISRFSGKFHSTWEATP